MPHQSPLVSVPEFFGFSHHVGFCIDAPRHLELEGKATVFRVVGSMLGMKQREILPCFILKFVLFYPAFYISQFFFNEHVK